MSDKDGLSTPIASAPSRRVSQGPVMPIGGAEETEPGGEILERFVDLAGGSDARIAIIPTASDDPQRSGEGYAELFRKLGAKKADWLRVEQRSDANTEEPLSLLREATGIFITGGDQTRLVELIVGTLVMECIRTRNADGVVAAGTSAGASILSTLMMAGGTGVGGHPGSDWRWARRGYRRAHRPRGDARGPRQQHGDHRRRAKHYLRLLRPGGRGGSDDHWFVPARASGRTPLRRRYPPGHWDGHPVGRAAARPENR